MKKAIFAFTFVVFGTFSLFAQKKENGTVYIEHPAIKVVDEFEKATVSGDSAKIASFLTEDFKGYNGTTVNLNAPATSKAAYLNTLLHYSRDLDYFAIETLPGSYPDAIDYKKDNKNGEIMVQNWILLKGIHKATGVKLDAGAHRLYYVTRDNKISKIASYANSKVIDEIFASYSNRTNGKIYNHHENINTIRKSMYALEKGDVDKAISFYSDDARISDINGDPDKPLSKGEEKVFLQKFLTDFEIKSIDMVGYPDYLEYEMEEGREVLSWWKFNLVRKKDKKAIVMPIHLSNSFDDKGKIIAEVGYYNEALLTK